MKNQKAKNKPTNPIPYEKKFYFFDMKLKIKVENINGTTNQKIEVFHSGKDKNLELTQSQMRTIYKYLNAEGFLKEAEIHNLHF